MPDRLRKEQERASRYASAVAANRKAVSLIRKRTLHRAANGLSDVLEGATVFVFNRRNPGPEHQRHVDRPWVALTSSSVGGWSEE